MASEFELELIKASLVPEVEFGLFINKTKVVSGSSLFCHESVLLQLFSSSFEYSTTLIADISKTEYAIPVNAKTYQGTLDLVVHFAPVLENQEALETPVNCRYISNINVSETNNINTKKILTHLEDVMGNSYNKMLEDIIRANSPSKDLIRPNSPSKSPQKKNSKSGNKTPAKSGKSPYKRSFSGLSFDQGGVVEIPSAYDIFMDKVSGKDSHSLMLVVAGLLARRRLLKATDDEDEIIKNILVNNTKAFEVMKEAFEETKAQIQSEKDEILYRTNAIKKEILDLDSQYFSLKTLNESLNATKDSLQKDLNAGFDEVSLLRKVSVENASEVLQTINDTRKATEESEQERKDLQDAYYKFLSDFKSEVTETDREISKMQDSLNKAISESNQKDVYLTHLIQDNTKLQGQLLSITSDLVVKLSHIDRINLINAVIDIDSQGIISLKSKLEDLIHRYQEVCNNTETEIENIRISKEDLDKKQEESNILYEAELQINADLAASLKEVKENLLNIRSLYKITNNIEQDFKNIQKRLIFSYENKEHVVREMKYLSDLILHFTGCYASAHRSFIKANNLLDQKSFEVITINEALVEVKKKYPVYFPVKEDSLDLALGNYLNGRDSGLSVPFIREGGGVYFFGTKKILINYERSKLTVKVGGGFLPIEEFINGYTDVELEKFVVKCQELSPKAKKFLGKWVGGIVDGVENTKKAKELLVQAAEEHKYAVSYAIKAPERSPSPLKKAKTTIV